MPRKTFTRYKRILEDELKVKQLDVYRLKDHDEIRVLAGSKVILIKLPKHREEMTLEEFKSVVASALRQSG